MPKFPSKETVERLRKEYPHGTRVELVRMDDPYSRLQPGDKGTVDFVDDSGTYEKLYVMESKILKMQ
jgi:hypothetical protein